MKSGLKIGVLAVQGAFIEHKRMLETLGCECVELRKKSDICDLDGLVLPGGESTVQVCSSVQVSLNQAILPRELPLS